MPEMGAYEPVPRGRVRVGATNYLVVPGAILISQATYAIAANRVNYFPIRVSTPITIDAIVIEVTTAAGAGSKARLGIYNADRNWQPTSLVVDAGEVAVDAIAVVSKAVSQVLPAGRYLLAITSDAAPTLRMLRGPVDSVGPLNTLGASALTYAVYVAKAYAAFSDPGTAWNTPSNTTAPFYQQIFLSVATP